MNLSQKCQYAMRALFELAKHEREGPVRIGQIAEAQAIPVRFLEAILNELKHAGYVESRRGVQGGYMLAVPAGTLTVGEVIRFIDGPQTPVRCLGEGGKADCALLGSCAFTDLWERAARAVAEVYDHTTLRDLVDQERASRGVPAYCI
jgi:Rrf2 family protein